MPISSVGQHRVAIMSTRTVPRPVTVVHLSTTHNTCPWYILSNAEFVPATLKSSPLIPTDLHDQPWVFHCINCKGIGTLQTVPVLLPVIAQSFYALIRSKAPYLQVLEPKMCPKGFTPN